MGGRNGSHYEAKEIQKKYRIQTSNVIADEDGVGGGVVDFLGCKGFINNSRPIKERIDGRLIIPNYENLKSQCSIKMAKKIVDRQTGELNSSITVIETTSEEMEQIKIKDVDKSWTIIKIWIRHSVC